MVQPQHSPVSNNIYVIGYPKSGNTWLVRLIGKLLQIKIEEYPMDGSTYDVASLANLEYSYSSEASVSKNHFLPHDFINIVDSAPKYIIYIYRDVRDVLISSFFYFNYSRICHDESFFYKSPSFSILSSVANFKAWRKGRNFFKEYISLFIEQGNKQKFGKWEQHIQQWQQYFAEQAGQEMHHVLVSYEQLVAEPQSTLSQIVSELKLHLPGAEHIRQIVQDEDFTKTKIRLGNMDNAADERAVQHHKYLIRKGQPGNWHKFLTHTQYNMLLKHYKNELKELHYLI